MTDFEPQPLPHSLAAPGVARRHLTARAAAWPPALLDVATLLTSELVTNAVVHSRGPVELYLDDDGDRLRIGVGDGLPGPLPQLPSRPPDNQRGGRGLLIVERLAGRWGCRDRLRPPGKVVWFEVPYGADGY